MNVHPTITCPLSFGPPFTAPRRRELHPDINLRLNTWFEELLPGVAVDIVEWIGVDLRHPLHAVVCSFRTDPRPAVVLILMVEEVERHHLVQAFGL